MAQDNQQYSNFNPFVAALHSDKEHAQMLMNLKSVLDSTHGKEFMKYLFKHFMVGEQPPIGLQGEFKTDMIGYLRAGTSIFDIAAQADPTTTGLLLAQAQREKYAILQKP